MKKNIWIFNHYAVPIEYFPYGRTHWFTKYLKKEGYSITIFSASSVHNKEYNFIKNKELYKYEKYENNDQYYIKARTCKSKFDRILNFLDYFFNLLKAVKILLKNNIKKPDIIFAESFHPLTLVAGIMIAKKLNIPCICEVRDLWPESLVSIKNISEKNIFMKILYKGEKWIYKNADALIFSMEGGRQYIIDKKWDKEINLNKVFHINNGVDLEEFNENLLKYKISDTDLEDKKTFKVVYTGALSLSKNIRKLIEVVEEVKKNEKCNIKFFIYGSGNDKEYLEKYCKENKLNNIYFKGNVNKKYIPYILSKMDLNFLHGGNFGILRYGSSFNKSFEYLASGHPILLDEEVSYDYIEKNDAGIMVKNPLVKNIADKIIYFYKMDREKYLNYCKNASKVSKKYDFKELTKELIKIIEKVGEK